MTTETQPDGNVQGQETKVEDSQNKGPASLEEAMALIENLRGINKEVIQTRDKANAKLRSFEREQTDREQALLQEQGKFKELYEAAQAKNAELVTGLKNKAVDSALKEVLQKAGARAVDTVSKLVDKSKIVVSDEDYSVDVTSIQAQIEEIKKTDPILFGVGEGNNLPPVKRPNDGTPAVGYETEMRAAKNQNEVLAVMKKYGKI